MNKITLQEVFDKMLFGLRAQGVKSEGQAPDGTAYCVYRNVNGYKCGIGQAIPDELYRPEFDGTADTLEEGVQLGTGIGTLMQKFPELNEFFSGCSMHDLYELQDIHDQFMPSEKGESMIEFEYRMEQFAKERNLVYTPPSP